jgi:DNA-directed RNA polymerase subunit RPC12/RpoP
MARIPDAMAPCGVYCGACPSFGSTCRGCGSDDRDQKRVCKWGCKLRRCCLEARGLSHCAECDEFPCKEYVAKLHGSHPDDPRFAYRREAAGNLKRVQEVGADEWLREEDARWRCPDCGGRVVFWKYVCVDCGNEVPP